MKRFSLISALLTALFCSAFAVAVDAVLNMVTAAQVAMIAALSGFLGSLFAQFVLNRGK